MPRWSWLEVQQSANWKELSTQAIANSPTLREEQEIQLELIPLYELLASVAARFGLMHHDSPAVWAMETALETLHLAAEYTSGKTRWSHRVELSEEYPARSESGWTNVCTGVSEEELFTIVIEIPPKQHDESLKAFEKRFNKACREKRKAYLRGLNEACWSRRRSEALLWADRLALWQAGRSQSEIDPEIKTASDRSAFSHAITTVAKQIGITPRKSPHNPLHGKSKF